MFFKAITKGDKEFFYLSRMQRKKILEYKYMNGSCFHLAVKYFQKDICHILVTLYGFGAYSLKFVSSVILQLFFIYFLYLF